MKVGLLGILCLFTVALGSAQAPQPVAPSLDTVLSRVQEAATTTDADLGKLHIDKWKTDVEQKTQLQQIATSLHKNLTFAVPELMRDVQSGKGSVSATFRLYH